LHNLWSRN